MKNAITLLAMGLFLFTNVQAQTSGNSSETVKVQIVDAGHKMVQALDKKDAKEFGSFFTKDAYFKLSGKEALKGRQQIIDSHEEMVSHGLKLSIESKEVHTFGEFAAEIGNYEITSPDGKTVDKGVFSTLWKKDNGEWKIYRDVISTSLE
jgi:uncharacterized protein (TIGR02246 family)